VKGVGFDGRNRIRFGIRQEELEELQVEVDAGDQDKIESEFGDVLSMINYARFLNVNPEDALERTKKFINRFQYLESKAGELVKPLMDMTLLKWMFFGKKRSDFQKIGIESLIFKSFKFGKKEATQKKNRN
jgi:XTP/dITP diphosphohydrolase